MPQRHGRTELSSFEPRTHSPFSPPSTYCSAWASSESGASVARSLDGAKIGGVNLRLSPHSTPRVLELSPASSPPAPVVDLTESPPLSPDFDLTKSPLLSQPRGKHARARPRPRPRVRARTHTHTQGGQPRCRARRSSTAPPKRGSCVEMTSPPSSTATAGAARGVGRVSVAMWSGNWPHMSAVKCRFGCLNTPENHQFLVCFLVCGSTPSGTTPNLVWCNWKVTSA